MAAKDTKKMEIHTCYTVKIKHQLDAVPDSCLLYTSDAADE